MFLEIRNLNFRYKNAEEMTVKDFSLEMKKGEILSILGDSGSGKSTVLRLIAGLEVPKHGEMQVNGEVIVDDQTYVLPEKRGIGMVFQDYALFPHMTVKENILFGLSRSSRKEKEDRLQEVLALVNLIGFEKRYPYELSGGQQQRVALARALAPRPSLLLLDEPFSNLDASLQERIRAELKDIIKETGITSIFVTHNPEDAVQIADRVLILQGGLVQQEGDPQEIL